MLKRRHRLSRARDVKRVYARGRAVRHGVVFLKLMPATSPRVAFVVAKKVAQRAVERNRIKRGMREGVRRILDRMEPYDVVCTALPGATRYSVQEICDMIREAFERARILSPL